MKHYRKKASEATLMYGLRQRLMRPRHTLLITPGIVAFAVLLTLYAFPTQTSAAHAARPGDSVTLTFTVTVKAGTAPSDVLFWFCPDAKTDGTGCDQMTARPDGTFTYQFAATTGATYQHVIIEWSHGRLPTSNGPIPAPPVHIACDYHPFNVTADAPHSFTCNADFTPATVTPVPSAGTNTPTPAATTTPNGAAGSSDNSTLITGLQIIIGVGLVLFLLLLAILIWQRMGARRR
jgi:hypothetical protein